MKMKYLSLRWSMVLIWLPRLEMVKVFLFIFPHLSLFSLLNGYIHKLGKPAEIPSIIRRDYISAALLS